MDDFDYSRPAREWPIPEMDHEAGAKETAFTWPMGDLILARIAEGETVKAITADPRMPAYCTVFRWMQVVPEFGEAVRGVRANLAAERVARWDGLHWMRTQWAPYEAKLAGKRWWRRGRPSSYTRAVGEAICARLEDGESMSAINGTPGMPSAKVVYRWLKTEPEFREMVIKARRVGRFILMIEGDEVCRNATPATLKDAKAEVARIDGWTGRIMPKVWGRPDG